MRISHCLGTSGQAVAAEGASLRGHPKVRKTAFAKKLWSIRTSGPPVRKLLWTAKFNFNCQGPLINGASKMLSR